MDIILHLYFIFEQNIVNIETISSEKIKKRTILTSTGCDYLGDLCMLISKKNSISPMNNGRALMVKYCMDPIPKVLDIILY